MVSSLSDTLDTACLSLTIIENGTERPTSEQLSSLDDIIVSNFGWAFRFGMGASESLGDYRYGYILPGKTLNPQTLKNIESKIKERTELDDPSVIAKPRKFPKEDIDSMEQLGRLPSEVLDSLQDLKDKIE
jgi:hypothetical protein